MFDFVGVTDFHGDDEEDIAGGVIDAKGEYKLERDSRVLLTLDVDDHIDPATREWLTLDEDGRIVRPPEHEARASSAGGSWRMRCTRSRSETMIWTSTPSTRSAATIRRAASSAAPRHSGS